VGKISGREQVNVTQNVKIHNRTTQITKKMSNADPTKAGLLSFEMIFDIKIQQLYSRNKLEDIFVTISYTANAKCIREMERKWIC
jgi:hypothetical protein